MRTAAPLLALLLLCPAARADSPPLDREALRDAFLRGYNVPAGPTRPELAELRQRVERVQWGMEEATVAQREALRLEIVRVAQLLSNPPLLPDETVLRDYLTRVRGTCAAPSVQVRETEADAERQTRVTAALLRNAAALGLLRDAGGDLPSASGTGPAPARGGRRLLLSEPEPRRRAALPPPPNLDHLHAGQGAVLSRLGEHTRPIFGGNGDLLVQTRLYLNALISNAVSRTQDRLGYADASRDAACAGGVGPRCVWQAAYAFSGRVVEGLQQTGFGLTNSDARVQLKTAASLTPLNLIESVPQAGTQAMRMGREGVNWTTTAGVSLAMLGVALDAMGLPGRGAAGPLKHAIYQPEVFTAAGSRVAARQALDESGRIALVVSGDSADGLLSVTLAQKSVRDGVLDLSVPSAGIADGVRVMVDGVPLAARQGQFPGFNAPWLEWARGGEGARPRHVEITLHGEVVGRYIYDPVKNELVREMAPRQISAFDARLFARDGTGHASEWGVHAPLVDATQRPASVLDLHTHFGGALRAESIVEGAMRSRTPFPVELLRREGVRFPESAVTMVDGRPAVTLDALSPLERAKLTERMSIPPDRTISFERMEEIYALRGPLVKDRSSLPFYLRTLAQDYRAQGVRYAEISLSDVLRPEWMAEIRRVLPAVERETGVQLRFVAAFWRHSDAAYNRELVEKVIALGRDRYVVGVDFMGHETNATLSFAAELRALAEFRRTQRPDFQIRVHAGENPENLGNIKEAIRLGATRIGHGVYGVDRETLDLARKHGVIIEFNANSNLALQNIDARAALPIKRYLDAGVRVTLGTDGHGLYHSSARGEEAVLRGMGLDEKYLRMIRDSDARYLREMSGL